jgi:SNF2 family DNA or RNA helicase
LGKTLTTLDAIKVLGLKRVIIVAPLRCCHSVWPPEIEKWAPELEFTILDGTPKTRARLVEQWEEGILLVNYEKLVWLNATFPQLWGSIDLLVLDESSKMKNPRASRFKKLKKVLYGAPRQVQLTGSPAANGLTNLWAQIFLLDQGQRLGKFYGHFTDRFFTSDYMGWVFTPKDPEKIYSLVADITHTLSADGLVEMAALDQVSVPVPVSAPEYAEMYSEGVTREVMAESSAIQQLKLRQIACGFIYDEEKRPIALASDKLKALQELVMELSGQPVIIFYEFTHNREEILALFGPKTAQIFTDASVRPWNQGEIPILVMNPASAGHGLNLQEGGCNIIWFTPPFDLELHDQATARLWRSGQTAETVRSYYLVGEDSIDEKVMEVLKLKERTQGDMLAALDAYTGKWALDKT